MRRRRGGGEGREREKWNRREGGRGGEGGEMHLSSRRGFPKLCFYTGVTQPGSECNHVIS